MLIVELPHEPIFRGQTLKGAVHISVESPKTAKKIKIKLVRKEKYKISHKHSSSQRDEHILFKAKNVDIMPPEKYIRVEYTISEDAPFTFDAGLSRVTWQIKAYVRFGFLPKIEKQEVVVLPHVLKSGSPPEGVPLPSSGGVSVPFHSWECTGSFHKSSRLTLFTGDPHYSPGDTVSGSLHFTEEFKNADCAIYLVFLAKAKSYAVAEKEYAMVDTHDTFVPGSSVPFSFVIPPTGYPSLETEHSKLWWMVRAVVKRSLQFTKVVEQEIQVTPLVF